VKNANLRISTKKDPRGNLPDGADIGSLPIEFACYGSDAIKGGTIHCLIVARQTCSASDILNEVVMRSGTKATLLGSAGSILKR